MDRRRSVRVERPPDHAVTRLLRQIADGEDDAYRDLFPLVYDELYRLALRQHRRLRGGDTLGPSALLNEAYLKLAAAPDPQWNGRAHFYAVAARAMRQILVDYARRGRAAKRGGGRELVNLDAVAELVAESRPRGEPAEHEPVLALDAALARLEQHDARLARVVECRFFAGMTIPETADALSISPATVKRDWSLARAWLYRELSSTEV